MQRNRAHEARQAAAEALALHGEIEALERAREADHAMWEDTLAILRADNALLTAATMRMHEQWSRDAVELESMRVEMQAMDMAAAAGRAETQTLLDSGASLAEERYRRAERRRALDIRVLATELSTLETAGESLIVEQQRQHLRLLADARCIGREVCDLEGEAEREAAEVAARAEKTAHAQREAMRLSAHELQALGMTLDTQSEQLDGVLEALRTWEACDAAERAHVLVSADRLEAASRALDKALSDGLSASALSVALPRGHSPLRRSRSFTSSGLTRGTPLQQWARSPARGGGSVGLRRMASSLSSIDSSALDGSEAAAVAGVGWSAGASRSSSIDYDDGVSAAIASSVEEEADRARRLLAEREWLEWLASPRSTPPAGGPSRPTTSTGTAPSAKQLAKGAATLSLDPADTATATAGAGTTAGTTASPLQPRTTPKLPANPATPKASARGSAFAAAAASLRADSVAAEGDALLGAAALAHAALDGGASAGGINQPGHVSMTARPSGATRAASASSQREQRSLVPPMQLHRCARPPEGLNGPGAIVVPRPKPPPKPPQSGGHTAERGMACSGEADVGAPRLQPPVAILTPVPWSPGAFPMGLPVHSLVSAAASSPPSSCS